MPTTQNRDGAKIKEGVFNSPKIKYGTYIWVNAIFCSKGTGQACMSARQVAVVRAAWNAKRRRWRGRRGFAGKEIGYVEVEIGWN